jgi:high-affinity iron transporter
MLGSLFVTLREGFEAALVIGIVLAYLRKTGAGDRARHVWYGVAAAIAASILMGAVIFASAGELEGRSEQLYEGVAMLLAASVLTWMIFWMQRQARTLGQALRDRVSQALVLGGTALFWVSFVAVAREGIETALFMYAATNESSPAATLVGGTVGLVIAIALGVAVYRGGVRLNMRAFFQVTSLILLVFAAYLLRNSLHEFGEVAGNELLEEAAIPIALVYVITVIALYLRPPGWLVPAEKASSTR